MRQGQRTTHEHFSRPSEPVRIGPAAAHRPRGLRIWAWLGGSGTNGGLSNNGDFERRRFAVQALIVLFFVSGIAGLATVASVN